MFFELNCGYYPYVCFEEDNNRFLQFKTADKLSTKLLKLKTVYQKNLQHTQDLYKQAYNKDIRLKSFALRDKV